MYFMSNSPTSEPVDAANKEPTRVVLDIDDFVSPDSRILTNMERPIAVIADVERIDIEKDLEKENFTEASKPPTPLSVHADPPAATAAEEKDHPPPPKGQNVNATANSVFRDIGLIELSLRPDAYEPVGSLFFHSPLLLILHALKIRHDITVLSPTASPASLHIHFAKGDATFSSSIGPDNLKTEYPVIRQVLRRLGLYQTPGSDQEDLWADELLALLSSWSSLLLGHRRAVLALEDRVQTTEEERRAIDAYPALRESFYRALFGLWEGKMTAEGPALAWRILTQQMLYADGAAREVLIDLISDFYGKIYQDEELKKWTRTLHSSWSHDHLLQYQILFDLNSDVMASSTVRAWYLGREQSLMAPHDAAIPLALHEAIMNGHVDECDRAEGNLPPPERSAALSPRPASPVPQRNDPRLPHPFAMELSPGSDPYVHAPPHAPGGHPGYPDDPHAHHHEPRYPHDPRAHHHDPHAYAHDPRHEPFGAAFQERFEDVPDWFAHEGVPGGATIGKRSPIHASICTSPPSRNKKRFGYC